MKNNIFKIKSLIICIFFITSCSLFKEVTRKEKIVISTVPSQAKVYDQEGNLLGETPLEISQIKLKDLSADRVLGLKIEKEEYRDTEVFISIDQITNVSVVLKKLSIDHFKGWVLKAYPKKMNEYSRDLLYAQALIFGKKLKKARSKLVVMQEQYPNIAVIYTMLAQIEISTKRFSKARNLLEQAKIIDKSDKTADRMLRMLRAN